MRIIPLGTKSCTVAGAGHSVVSLARLPAAPPSGGEVPPRFEQVAAQLAAPGRRGHEE